MSETTDFILKGIGLIIGTVLASAIDIIVFGAIAAIPLAALAYLNVITQATAMALLIWVAIIIVILTIIKGLQNL